VKDDAEPSDAQHRPSLGATARVAEEGEEGNISMSTSNIINWIKTKP